MGDLSPHFSRAEFACHCGCGFNTPAEELVTLLETMRQAFKTPIIIVSGCRCPAHNAACGGVKNSQHLLGKAADIVVPAKTPTEVANLAAEFLDGCGGIGIYRTFTHVDVRPGGMARWRG